MNTKDNKTCVQIVYTVLRCRYLRNGLVLIIFMIQALKSQSLTPVNKYMQNY